MGTRPCRPGENVGGGASRLGATTHSRPRRPQPQLPPGDSDRRGPPVWRDNDRTAAGASAARAPRPAGPGKTKQPSDAKRPVGPQLLARPAREAALVALEVGGPRGCGFPRATQSRPGASSQDVAPQGGRRGRDSPEARGEGWKDVAGKPRSPDPQPWSLPPVPGPAHQVQIRRQGPASGSGPAGSADRAPPPGPGNRRPRPHAACGADSAWRRPGDAPGVPAPHHLRAPPRRGRGPPAPNAQALLLC